MTQEDIKAREAEIDKNELLGQFQIVMDLDSGKSGIAFENRRTAEIFPPQVAMQIFAGILGVVRELILVKAEQPISEIVRPGPFSAPIPGTKIFKP